jgi:glycosyltransferase involved in cell wall biosynthesis
MFYSFKFYKIIKHMNKKPRILLVPSDTQGVGHFRSIWPAQSLQKNFSDQIDIDLAHEVKFNDFNELSKYDIIHFHRNFGPYEEFEKISGELRKRGIITIMDIDDYWEPPTTHPLYQIVKQENLSEKILNNIKHSDYITTTTKTFKKHINKYNENVFIIPNALDVSHKMWKSEVVPNETGKCRISWIGGSSHLHDLKNMEHSLRRLNTSSELKDKYQFILCGFDTRGTITQIMPNGQKNVRKIEPHETIWCKFEEIFTTNYDLIKEDEKYLTWLKKIKKEDYPDLYKKNYVRRWTLPLTQYGKHYDFCDVCLAPLQDKEQYKDEKGTIKSRPHYFNEVKSELKIIESGMKKKVLIAQDFGVYREFIKDGYNGILVNDNKKGWYKALKEVILNEGYRKKLANNLHEFVKDKYEITNVTKQRLDIYKQIIQERDNGKLMERRQNQFKKIMEEKINNK